MLPKPAGPIVSRAEWLGARATLAGQRSARFAVTVAVAFVVALLALLAAPALSSSRGGDAGAVTPRIDTLPLLQRADSARRAVAHADSQVDAALLVSELAFGANDRLTPAQRQSRDSLHYLASSLDDLLDRATKAPLPASFHALAAAAALRGDARTKSLSDSLDVLDRHRASLGPTTGAERASAGITAQVNDVGSRIREVAQRRRTRLARDITAFETAAGVKSVPPDTLAPRAARDFARTAALRVDSSVAVARAANAEAERLESAALDRVNRRVPPAAMLVAVFVLVLIGGFSLNLVREVGKPTIANAPEAERATGAPVITIVRAPVANPRSGGIDPFRMLYLGLTATGTRMRTVAISGDERGVVAAVAARLALAAAGDARATLVVDADAEGSPVGGYYRQPPEPGFTDAVAGVRLWREVTHPVGASDGLSIDVVPGGALRQDVLDAATLDSGRAEFARVRSEYDFCVVVAPTEVALQRLVALADKPVMVLCAEMGTTSLERLAEDSVRARAAGVELQGLVLWDAPVPKLQTRSDQLSGVLAEKTRSSQKAANIRSV